MNLFLNSMTIAHEITRVALPDEYIMRRRSIRKEFKRHEKILRYDFTTSYPLSFYLYSPPRIIHL